MQSRSLVKLQDGKLLVPEESAQKAKFFCNLLWPHIDAYWLTLTFSLTLLPNFSIGRKFMVVEIHSFGTRLYEDRIIHSVEGCIF
jgi:hypothetical protein